VEWSEADKFAAHVYQSRRQYRRTSERPNKGNKAIEREILSSYQIAHSLGFNGDFRRLGALAADSRVKALCTREAQGTFHKEGIDLCKARIFETLSLGFRI
jgi:hypothetical protein